jgi:hypothetical protein
MPSTTSPAGRTRARDLDRALDQAKAGQGRNRDAADQQVPPSHGDKTLSHPNTNNRRVGR